MDATPSRNQTSRLPPKTPSRSALASPIPLRTQLFSPSSRTASAVALNEDNVQTIVRVRPLSDKEENEGRCVRVDEATSSVLLSGPSGKVFSFDWVAGEHSSQADIFNRVGRTVADSCLSGSHGTIFAYGQTGGGKSYTMQGAYDDGFVLSHSHGLIPRMLDYLFNKIAFEQANGTVFSCRVSYLEIYNDVVSDLLAPTSTPLQLREDLRRGIYVEGAVEETVTSASEAFNCLSTGARQRHVSSTAMNKESSRSHAVFCVTIESKTATTAVTAVRYARLNLVDLAGSERQKDTGTQGTALKEACTINRSLSALGNVINALCEVALGKSRHVSYRDSKLTFLLKDSLGGNTRTVMIAAISPSSQCYGETLSTLKFAQRAKNIKNRVTVNEDVSGSSSVLQEEVRRLRAEVTQQQHVIDELRGKEILSDRLYLHPQFAAVASAGEVPHGDSVRNLEVLLLRAFEHNKRQKDELSAAAEKVQAAKTFVDSRQMLLMSTKTTLRLREEALKRATGGKGCSCGDEQIREEINALRSALVHHPEVSRFAMENLELRDLVKQLQHDNSDAVAALNGEAMLRKQIAILIEEKHKLQEEQSKRIIPSPLRVNAQHLARIAELEKLLDEKSLLAEELQTALHSVKLVAAVEKESFELQIREVQAGFAQDADLAETQRKLAEATAQVSATLHLEKEVSDNAEKLRQMHDLLASETVRCEMLEKVLATLQLQQNTELQRFETEVAAKDRSCSELIRKLEIFETNAAEAAAQLAKKNTQLEQLVAELANAADESDTVKAECEFVKIQLGEMSVALQSRQLELERLQQHFAATHEAAQVDATMKLVELTTTLEHERQRARKCDVERDDARCLVTTLQSELGAVQSQIVELTIRLRVATLQEEELQQSLADELAIRSDLERTIVMLTEKNAAKKTQLHVLKAELSSLQFNYQSVLEDVTTMQEQLAAPVTQICEAAETQTDDLPESPMMPKCHNCTVRMQDVRRLSGEWETQRERKNTQLSQLRMRVEIAEENERLAAERVVSAESTQGEHCRTIAILEQQLETVQQKLQDAQLQTDSLQAELQGKSGQEKVLQSRFTERTEQYKQLLADLRESKAQEHETWRQNRELDLRIGVLTSEFQSQACQIAALTEENARLVGHNNHRQRIQHHYKVKEDYNQLQQKHAVTFATNQRLEEELRRLKRIPKDSAITFDEEEEQRVKHESQLEVENCELKEKLGSIAQSLQSATSELGLSAGAPEMLVQQLAGRAVEATREARANAQLLQLHEREAAVNSTIAELAAAEVARTPKRRFSRGQVFTPKENLSVTKLRTPKVGPPAVLAGLFNDSTPRKM
eukprot:TRINITY_DN1055_c0_g1_i1.p1 TRINITY_DN1055_c0_g1~~TRINITY_DN1055_c0_g1_i1.p1  ORF type:complete len:1336 (-),score=302.71 TRINITY_DN1055_c0_g1_i1:6065-10072(-)